MKVVLILSIVVLLWVHIWVFEAGIRPSTNTSISIETPQASGMDQSFYKSPVRLGVHQGAVFGENPSEGTDVVRSETGPDVYVIVLLELFSEQDDDLIRASSFTCYDFFSGFARSQLNLMNSCKLFLLRRFIRQSGHISKSNLVKQRTGRGSDFVVFWWTWWNICCLWQDFENKTHLKKFLTNLNNISKTFCVETLTLVDGVLVRTSPDGNAQSSSAHMVVPLLWLSVTAC